MRADWTTLLAMDHHQVVDNRRLLDRFRDWPYPLPDTALRVDLLVAATGTLQRAVALLASSSRA